MKEYEAMVIFDAGLEDEKIEEAVAKVEALIKKNGGQIDKIDSWGKKKLAYPIKKQAMGYYSLYYFKGPEDSIKEMDRVLRISDDVMRHMFVRKDS